jgi:hypothetical protein
MELAQKAWFYEVLTFDTSNSIPSEKWHDVIFNPLSY